MKLFFPIVLLFIFKSYSQSLENFIAPKNAEKLVQVEGDLDKDGVDEIVYAYQSNIPDIDSSFVREIYICKNVNGQIKLWKKNNSILWKTGDFGNDREHNADLKILNYTLILEQTFYSNARSSSRYKSIFRYQNNDWYLIGSNCFSAVNCLFEAEDDINFSTKKVIIKQTATLCDDSISKDKDQNFSFRYPFKRLPKMDNFIPGKIFLKIPGKDQTFNY